MKIFLQLKGLLMRVAVLMSNVLRRKEHDGSLDKERGEEPKRRLERKRSSKLQEGDSKTTSKVRRQPKKSKLSSKNGGNVRSRKGLKGQPNKASSSS
mgnify:CR=1 FL=1